MRIERIARGRFRLVVTRPMVLTVVEAAGVEQAGRGGL